MSFVENVIAGANRRQVILVAIGVVALSAILIVMYFALLKTHYDVLFSDLRNVDAATIVEQLDKEKIPYQLRKDGSTILVPKDKVDKTRLELMGGNLPLKGTVGFELFNKSDMGVTEFAQKINYQRALQGELARTIMAMEGVEEARIHLALAEPTIFRDDRTPAKASVTILTKPGRQLSDKTIRGVQRLIAAAVPDLDVANVVVLNGQGDVVSESPSDGVSTLWVDQKQAVEELYESKIHQALSKLYPTEHFDVTVTAAAGAGTAIANPEEVMRSYPLRVSVIAAADLRSGEANQIHEVVIHEINADPNISDAINVSSAAASVAANAGPQAGSARPGEANSGSSWFEGLDARTIIFALLFLSLVAVIPFARWSKPSQRKLTEEQRLEIVDRLKVLIDGLEPHGHS